MVASQSPKLIVVVQVHVLLPILLPDIPVEAFIARCVQLVEDGGL